MSTDIKPSSLNVNLGSYQSPKVNEQQGGDQTKTSEAVKSDNVSMTPEASRLKEIESRLSAIPDVNQAKVDEIRQAIADGSFEIDAERVADKLLNFEATLSGKG